MEQNTKATLQTSLQTSKVQIIHSTSILVLPANTLETQAKALRAQAQAVTDPATIAKLTAGADQAEAGVNALRKQQGEVQDKY